MAQFNNGHGSNLGYSGQFQFVSVQNPNEEKDRKAMRLARSHAVSNGLDKKRKLQQKSGLNFRTVSCVRDEPNRNAGVVTIHPAISSFSIYTPSPFQMLASESPRLQTLLKHYESRQSIQPVLSISDERVLQNFQLVFQQGQDDRALLSAFMLTFAFAATGSIDKGFLKYQSQALTSIRQQMTSVDKSPSESTLGAILLLAGIEAQLGMPQQVQLHMGAVKQLLKICGRRGVYLSDSIKRAIFWQDLNSAVLTGSSRIVDHTTFSELLWKRDPFSPGFYTLPPGFQPHIQLLGEDLVEIFKDVHGLQCIRESTYFKKNDDATMAYIDNHQASIQSRLISITNHTSFSESCALAAYLCSATLRCKLFHSSITPSHLSSQLLFKLQQTTTNQTWDDDPSLLVWLLNLGGGFAPPGPIRSGYAALLDSNQSGRFKGLFTSWEELLGILKRFIWSDNAFLVPLKGFWEEMETKVTT